MRENIEDEVVAHRHDTHIAFTQQIFKDDLKNIYVQQTAYRDRLQKNALEVMESLI